MRVYHDAIGAGGRPGGMGAGTMDDAAADGPEAVQSPQADMELDPARSDTSRNEPLDGMGVDAATLFRQALEQTRMAISITDPHREDGPIIYVNRAFCELTGYDREDVIGRNCRFLQGDDTDAGAVGRVRDALAAERVEVIEMLNYRKDGTPFWNALHVGPVYDDDGHLTHFYGSQWDISDTVAKRARIALQAEVADELQHRTRNLFGVINAILRITARSETTVEGLAKKVEARLQALDRAHQLSVTNDAGKVGATDLRDLVASILTPYRNDRPARIAIVGNELAVPSTAVTPLGLMLHELATNSLKYGAFSVAEGNVTVRWRRDADAVVLEWIEEKGPAISAPTAMGTGTRIMEGVLRSIGADIHYDWPPTGLSATLTMRLEDG